MAQRSQFFTKAQYIITVCLPQGPLGGTFFALCQKQKRKKVWQETSKGKISSILFDNSFISPDLHGFFSWPLFKTTLSSVREIMRMSVEEKQQKTTWKRKMLIKGRHMLANPACHCKKWPCPLPPWELPQSGFRLFHSKKLPSYVVKTRQSTRHRLIVQNIPDGKKIQLKNKSIKRELSREIKLINAASSASQHNSGCVSASQDEPDSIVGGEMEGASLLLPALLLRKRLVS